MFFAYSCPFVSIRGSPSSPSLVFFCAFSAFCGSNTAWTTFLHIRVHSWFSLFPLLRVFSCFSCFSWFKHCLDHVFFAYSCPFVSIRGSPSSPPFVFFSCISCFSWFKHCLDYVFCIFVSIRVHSWFKPVFGLRSCPFVSIRGSNQYLDYVSVNSWFSLFPLLRVFSCFSCFSWFDSPFSCLMRRAQARHPRTTLSSLLPSPYSLFVHFLLFSTKST